MLHLKFALMLDKEMGEAEELLKALKCIELLKKEKDSLEREVPTYIRMYVCCIIVLHVL